MVAFPSNLGKLLSLELLTVIVGEVDASWEASVLDEISLFADKLAHPAKITTLIISSGSNH